MSRDHILHKVRTAIGRSAGQAPDSPPLARILVPEVDLEERINRFFLAIEKLGGKTFRAASSSDARSYVEAVIGGGPAVASNAPFLADCGITGLPSVRGGFHSREDLKTASADAGFGVTSADYALADTGSLVMLSSPAEARLVSLLPPVHLALVPKERILTGLDELFATVPKPAELTSSMVLITGPSRTADIEQILVRGVHGPGELHVVVI